MKTPDIIGKRVITPNGVGIIRQLHEYVAMVELEERFQYQAILSSKEMKEENPYSKPSFATCYEHISILGEENVDFENNKPLQVGDIIDVSLGITGKGDCISEFNFYVNLMGGNIKGNILRKFVILNITNNNILIEVLDSNGKQFSIYHDLAPKVLYHNINLQGLQFFLKLQKDYLLIKALLSQEIGTQ